MATNTDISSYQDYAKAAPSADDIASMRAKKAQQGTAKPGYGSGHDMTQYGEGSTIPGVGQGTGGLY
jgi:hypothetical protein